MSGSYQMKYAITFSGNLEIRSGDPLARTVSFTGGKQIKSITLNVEPIGSETLPVAKLLDLRLQKALSMGKNRKLDLRLNVYNVLNVNAITDSDGVVGTELRLRHGDHLAADRRAERALLVLTRSAGTS